MQWEVVEEGGGGIWPNDGNAWVKPEGKRNSLIYYFNHWAMNCRVVNSTQVSWRDLKIFTQKEGKILILQNKELGTVQLLSHSKRYNHILLPIHDLVVYVPFCLCVCVCVCVFNSSLLWFGKAIEGSKLRDVLLSLQMGFMFVCLSNSFQTLRLILTFSVLFLNLAKQYS